MGISRNSHRHQTGGALGVGFHAGGHDIGSTPATVELLERSAVSGRPQNRGARKHRRLPQAGRVLLPSVPATEPGGCYLAQPLLSAELRTKYSPAFSSKSFNFTADLVMRQNNVTRQLGSAPSTS